MPPKMLWAKRFRLIVNINIAWASSLLLCKFTWYLRKHKFGDNSKQKKVSNLKFCNDLTIETDHSGGGSSPNLPIYLAKHEFTYRSHQMRIDRSRCSPTPSHKLAAQSGFDVHLDSFPLLLAWNMYLAPAWTTRAENESNWVWAFRFSAKKTHRPTHEQYTEEKEKAGTPAESCTHPAEVSAKIIWALSELSRYLSVIKSCARTETPGAFSKEKKWWMERSPCRYLVDAPVDRFQKFGRSPRFSTRRWGSEAGEHSRHMLHDEHRDDWLRNLFNTLVFFFSYSLAKSHMIN